MKPSELLTKDFLFKEYIELDKTISQIQKENGIKSSVSITNALSKYNIRKDISKKYDEILTKEYLIENYVNNGKSIKQICRDINISAKHVVRDRLKKYSIELQKRDNVNERYKNHCRSLRSHPVISGKYFSCIISGAKSRGLCFEIDINFAYDLFLKQNGKCALTNVELCFVDVYEKNRLQQTASLDRIDSSKGYTKDNVQWIHKTVNKMKMNLSEEEFIKWCKLISNNN